MLCRTDVSLSFYMKIIIFIFYLLPSFDLVVPLFSPPSLPSISVEGKEGYLLLPLPGLRVPSTGLTVRRYHLVTSDLVAHASASLAHIALDGRWN